MSEPRIPFELSPGQCAVYEREGLLRLPQAVDPGAAAAMADVLWRAMERRFGARPGVPETWTVRHPSGLGAAGRLGAFAAMASPVVTSVLDQLLGPDWIRPARWGVPLVTFPERAEWNVPHAQWHLDTPAMPSDPAIARVFLLLAPLRPRGGGTLTVAGSHLLFRTLARKEGRAMRSVEAKKRLLTEQDWFAQLSSPGHAGIRIRSFMEEGATIDGAEVRVVEMTGEAGDVYFMHPSLLHVPSSNASKSPRLMLTQWIDGKG